MSEALQLVIPVIPLVLALTAIAIDLFEVRRDRLRLDAIEQLSRTAEQLVSVIDRQAEGTVPKLTVGSHDTQSDLASDADGTQGGPA